MACRICSISPRPPILPRRRKLAKQELHVEASALGLSNKASWRRAGRPFNMNHLLTLMTTGRQPIPVLMSKGRPFLQMIMRCGTLNPGMHTTISGYWEGPDTEDGWGYIEASVSIQVLRSF